MDANLNRVREGLRVCEEIARFIWEEEEWFTAFRNLRHQVTQLALERMNLPDLIQRRDSLNDIGRGADSVKQGSPSEEDLLARNLQRTKEGLRVLEEFSHAIDPSIRRAFQTIRYTVYDLEKKIFSRLDENKRLSTLRHSG